jgi:hypothetical protein
MPAPLPVPTEESRRSLRSPRHPSHWRLLRRILTKLPDAKRVAQGPFEGMGYIPLATRRTTLPMLLGTYQSELNPALETICRAGCDRIVDIGAGEGYYAVGMALRNPGVPLVCFERNSSVRYYLRRLARHNGVRPRIKILGECTPAALEAALQGAEWPAVICDCEGAEETLLDPVRIPRLRRALILVETQGGLIAGVSGRLQDRFAATHEFEAIASRERTLDDLPAGCDLTVAEAAAMEEQRRYAEWMFMQLKSG